MQLSNPNDPDAGSNVLTEGPPEVDPERFVVVRKELYRVRNGRDFLGGKYFYKHFFFLPHK